MTHRTMTEVIQAVLDTYEHPFTVVRIDTDQHQVIIRPCDDVIAAQVDAVLPDQPESEIADWNDREAETGPRTPTYSHAADAANTWNTAATDEALPEGEEFEVWDALDNAGYGGVRPVFNMELTADDLLPAYRLLKAAHHTVSTL